MDQSMKSGSVSPLLSADIEGVISFFDEKPDWAVGHATGFIGIVGEDLNTACLPHCVESKGGGAKILRLETPLMALLFLAALNLLAACGGNQGPTPAEPTATSAVPPTPEPTMAPAPTPADTPTAAERAAMSAVPPTPEPTQAPAPIPADTPTPAERAATNDVPPTPEPTMAPEKTFAGVVAELGYSVSFTEDWVFTSDRADGPAVYTRNIPWSILWVNPSILPGGTLKQQAETARDGLEEEVRGMWPGYSVFELTSFGEVQAEGRHFYEISYRIQESTQFCVVSVIERVFAVEAWHGATRGIRATSWMCEIDAKRLGGSREATLDPFVLPANLPATTRRLSLWMVW